MVNFVLPHGSKTDTTQEKTGTQLDEKVKTSYDKIRIMQLKHTHTTIKVRL